MAQVDFSNAKITPVTNPSGYSANPVGRAYANLQISNGIYDASENSLVTNHHFNILKDVSRQFIFLWTGTFTASGTEFYIFENRGCSAWKVYNITFNAGDTYSFSIRADLICQ